MTARKVLILLVLVSLSFAAAVVIAGDAVATTAQDAVKPESLAGHLGRGDHRRGGQYVYVTLCWNARTASSPAR